MSDWQAEVQLEPFGDGIYTLEGDRLRMLGIPFETRMTVVRLSDGTLWLHSPVAPSEARFEAVASLGAVAHIVAPNKFHHLFLAPWAERFPGATTWADAALQARRRDFAFGALLAPGVVTPWGDAIDLVFFAGSRFLNEYTFFHRGSRTLIVTDLVQNHEPEADGLFWRTIKRGIGVLGPKGGSPLDWRLTVTDRAAARASRDAILCFDFERMIITHGRCWKSGARSAFEDAFRWLG